ncbi:Potassium-transporting ATPase KdpC subunit [Planktothrix tepida]|uniref:Potassium-transporting ATPase KdpC subunit n=2 Tax=Planktothrix TaxID=54304 RepID=A0A1J1LEP0_9CYAN|nr:MULTISPECIES: K(+)-transporting ATPase subunit C [Planktothrix]CAD5922245.1 Potassium-transporting ATPase KdpC subunit [Planktothrix tepida]CAD5982655.1 Potassium-transporting ATPase KdpC subunit [Planktothrix pseudagardhii]CUR31029.1 P-type ATPase, high-affinity potassium transport system, C chain [Planktothrix tepida PCC 9214]
MFRDLLTAIRTTLVLWVLTAILYPVLILIIGQSIFPFQANGSLIKNPQGEIVGSALIGQNFTSNRYFISRPSSVDYSPVNEGLATGISGGSNLAPSNPDLLKKVTARIDQLQFNNIIPTADLVYSSGSGLDPHISIQAANAQIQRVANARSLNPNQVEILVNKNTEHRFLGIFGEPGVNVMKVNLDLDNLSN